MLCSGTEAELGLSALTAVVVGFRSGVDEAVKFESRVRGMDRVGSKVVGDKRLKRVKIIGEERCEEDLLFRLHACFLSTRDKVLLI